MEADRNKISQVLYNLISNAIKYGQEFGEVRGQVTNESNQILISIKDNGIGIDEENIPRLFERFYRVDKGRSRSEGGTGLGLAIVKHIIEAHDEKIEVLSENVGTEFIFTLKKVTNE